MYFAIYVPVLLFNNTTGMSHLKGTTFGKVYLLHQELTLYSLVVSMPAAWL